MENLCEPKKTKTMKNLYDSYVEQTIDGTLFLDTPLMLFKKECGYCCDMGQNDTIGKIELNPSFVLSSVETNCKNDIQ